METDDKLITDNLNLAYKIAWNYYNKFARCIELEELRSAALLGLVKAAKAFTNKNCAFSTFAYRCIQNEILHYYNRNKKHLAVNHLSEPVGDNNILEDIIASNINMEDDVEYDINIYKLYEFINELNEQEKMVMLYSAKGLTQLEISEKLNLTPARINTIYRKAVNKLRFRFLRYDTYDL